MAILQKIIKERDNRTLCGYALIFFGVLFMLKEFGIISANSLFFDVKTYPIYMAIIFLLGKKEKIASFFGIISLIIWFPTIACYIGNIANLIWPAILIGVGVLLIHNVKKNKQKELSQHNDEVTEVEVEEINSNENE